MNWIYIMQSMIGVPSLYSGGIDCDAQLSVLWPKKKHSQQLPEGDCLISGEFYDVKWMLIQALLPLQPMNQREVTEHIIHKIELNYWMI